jgi:hypothetical protein
MHRFCIRIESSCGNRRKDFVCDHAHDAAALSVSIGSEPSQFGQFSIEKRIRLPAGVFIPQYQYATLSRPGAVSRIVQMEAIYVLDSTEEHCDSNQSHPQPIE